MSFPSPSQSIKEEFYAAVEFPSEHLEFKANKVNIENSVDTSGVECFTLMAFHDILKDPTKSVTLNNIQEVLGLHLYLPRANPTDDRALGRSAIPPLLNAYSGNFYKIVDKVPDKDNRIDTIVSYLGTSGWITYIWVENNTWVRGTFTLTVKGADGIEVKMMGHFNISNTGEHPI